MLQRSERRHRSETAVAAQLAIARRNGASDKLLAQPGRLRKHRAMDCGNPQCGLCGNPRRTGHKGALTVQEERQLQAYRSDLKVEGAADDGEDIPPNDTAQEPRPEAALVNHYDHYAPGVESEGGLTD